MDLASYRRKREELRLSLPTYRQICQTCLQPDFSCYCQWVAAFDPGILFVILIHPIEMHRRIATGRMAHLNLKNSFLIMGHDFSKNAQVNGIIARPDLHCMMLYPGRDSLNLTHMTLNERRSLQPQNKRLTVFVIDGTWATARKMVRLSQPLQKLPRLCFTPKTPSNFRVRRQPRPECYSTIEAIHHTIDLLTPLGVERPHDQLLSCFTKMVERQIQMMKRENRHAKK